MVKTQRVVITPGEPAGIGSAKKFDAEIEKLAAEHAEIVLVDMTEL